MCVCVCGGGGGGREVLCLFANLAKDVGAYSREGTLYVAKYHLGKVKLELMQLASMPDQLRSVRQVNMSLCSQRFSPLGVRDLWGRLQGFCRGLWFIAQLL